MTGQEQIHCLSNAFVLAMMVMTYDADWNACHLAML
jgi:hypothetical protein